MSDKSHSPVPPRKWFVPPLLAIAFVAWIVGCTVFEMGQLVVSNRHLPNELSVDSLQPLTTNLPSTDRIEIEAVHAVFEKIDAVLATKVLTGSQAQDFGTLWRTQDYDFGVVVACHEPAYRIRFYQSTTLLTEATVCFHCHNIYFYSDPEAMNSTRSLETAFGKLTSKDPGAPYTKLQSYLADLFPGHDAQTTLPAK